MKKQSTSGVGVKSGLSYQSGFSGESNTSLGNDTKSGRKNYMPVQPKKKLSVKGRGDFVSY